MVMMMMMMIMMIVMFDNCDSVEAYIRSIVSYNYFYVYYLHTYLQINHTS